MGKLDRTMDINPKTGRRHGPTNTPEGWCACCDPDCNLYRPTSGEALHKAYSNPRRQVGGDHYLKHGNMQPFDIIDEYELNFYEGTALKYLLRWREKGGVIDLEKAKHLIEILIQKERSPDGGNLPISQQADAAEEYTRSRIVKPEAPTS